MTVLDDGDAVGIVRRMQPVGDGMTVRPATTAPSDRSRWRAARGSIMTRPVQDYAQIRETSQRSASCWACAAEGEPTGRPARQAVRQLVDPVERVDSRQRRSDVPGRFRPPSRCCP
jgi:hypothetical protein